jgi:outer membrane protein assembly factor BamE (lipoprotein component of BamABCDE complex)
MKYILYSIFISFFITNCTLNKVVDQHGVNFLEKKQAKLIVNSSNANDIIQILGPPSTKSTFDDDMWIYIERVTSSSKIMKLGKKKLIANNVLILEINSKGLLSQKIFLDKEKMNNIKFTDDFIELSATKRGYVYDFLRTLRKKMNDPLGKK